MTPTYSAVGHLVGLECCERGGGPDPWSGYDNQLSQLSSGRGTAADNQREGGHDPVQSGTTLLGSPFMSLTHLFATEMSGPSALSTTEIAASHISGIITKTEAEALRHTFKWLDSDECSSLETLGCATAHHSVAHSTNPFVASSGKVVSSPTFTETTQPSSLDVMTNASSNYIDMWGERFFSPSSSVASMFENLCFHGVTQASSETHMEGDFDAFRKMLSERSATQPSGSTVPPGSTMNSTVASSEDLGFWSASSRAATSDASSASGTSVSTVWPALDTPPTPARHISEEKNSWTSTSPGMDNFYATASVPLRTERMRQPSVQQPSALSSIAPTMSTAPTSSPTAAMVQDCGLNASLPGCIDMAPESSTINQGLLSIAGWTTTPYVDPKVSLSGFGSPLFIENLVATPTLPPDTGFYCGSSTQPETLGCSATIHVDTPQESFLRFVGIHQDMTGEAATKVDELVDYAQRSSNGLLTSLRSPLHKSPDQLYYRENSLVNGPPTACGAISHSEDSEQIETGIPVLASWTSNGVRKELTPNKTRRLYCAAPNNYAARPCAVPMDCAQESTSWTRRGALRGLQKARTEMMSGSDMGTEVPISFDVASSSCVYMDRKPAIETAAAANHTRVSVRGMDDTIGSSPLWRAANCNNTRDEVSPLEDATRAPLIGGGNQKPDVADARAGAENVNVSGVSSCVALPLAFQRLISRRSPPQSPSHETMQQCVLLDPSEAQPCPVAQAGLQKSEELSIRERTQKMDPSDVLRIGGKHFGAPLVLAHPEEFKNPSSFLKVYGDPLCSKSMMSAEAKALSNVTVVRGQNGNWGCGRCGNINYPRRFRCNKCNELRNAQGDAVVAEYVLAVYERHLKAYRQIAQVLPANAMRGDGPRNASILNDVRKASPSESLVCQDTHDYTRRVTSTSSNGSRQFQKSRGTTMPDTDLLKSAVRPLPRTRDCATTKNERHKRTPPNLPHRDV